MKITLKRIQAAIYKKRQPLTTSFLLILVVMSYQNCQQSEFYEKAELASLDDRSVGPGSVAPAPVDDKEPVVGLCDKANPQELICNPLGEDPTIPTTPIENANEYGLLANLYEGQNGWNNLDRYFSEGYKHETAIYFSNFNVPTRSFSAGFNFSDSEFLKTKSGNRLVEWFAIEARGQLVLPDNEAEGLYQIATLSDDGIEVKVNDNVIISNKNTHAPTVNCATSLVKLTRNEANDFKLKYFQGPRHQIALMTFIKKISSSTVMTDLNKTACKKDVESLKKDGYTVIAPQWFKLPVNN